MLLDRAPCSLLFRFITSSRHVRTEGRDYEKNCGITASSAGTLSVDLFRKKKKTSLWKQDFELRITAQVNRRPWVNSSRFSALEHFWRFLSFCLSDCHGGLGSLLQPEVISTSLDQRVN